MAEELKKYFGDPLTGVWAILVGVLLLGLAVHSQGQEWNNYWALWITEASTFVLIAVFFYKPSQITGYGAVAGSAVWLLNQLNCWYYGEMTHLPPAQAMPYLMQIFYITAAFNAIILGVVYWKRDEVSGASVESGVNWGTIGLLIMTLFSGWKIYELHRLWTIYGGFVPGTPSANSAYAWAIGILIMSLGSILYLRSTRDNNKASGVYIAAIGLLIASFAALYYGLALSLTGHVI